MSSVTRSEGTPQLQDLVAVVTGAGSGIGRATAELLRNRGARVASLDLDNTDAPEGVLPVECDVRSSPSVAAAVASVATRWGGIDIVVNNAGVEARGGILDQDDAEWARVLDVNITGMARVVRAALPHLRRSRAGVVVNMGSVAALQGMALLSLYSASKGAVLAFTRALAADLLADGIRVCSVSPGTVHTPWIGRLLAGSEDPDAVLEAVTSRQPDRRLISAAEVAAAVAFLVDPSMRAITGANLAIDGGISGLHLSAAV